MGLPFTTLLSNQDFGFLSMPKVRRVRQREVNGKSSTETSYFIASLENQAPTLAKAIREHWGIENGLHWCLDISFREDHCCVRKDHAPENLAILRHLATNMLKRENSLKGGLGPWLSAKNSYYVIFTCDCPDKKSPILSDRALETVAGGRPALRFDHISLNPLPPWGGAGGRRPRRSPGRGLPIRWP
jgi:predicted transposase YbfD/YdcC